MLTIDEIARMAHVSPATVSKVLNNRSYVSATTRERVERIIAETGYIPSQRARGLSQRRSYILGLVIPYTSEQLFADPHLLEIMRGIESVASRHDYNLLLSLASAPDEAESACTRLLRSDMIDMAIIVETNDVQRFAEALANQPTPWAVIGYARGRAAVHADDFGGALAATRHLIQRGHRRIGVISSAPRPFAIEERLRGVRAALAEADLALPAELLAVGDFSLESGARAGAALLDLADPPSAIFALNDRMALGVVRAAAEHRMRVPTDLSVIGFDDISLATLLSPPLTTVRQSGFRIGAAAAGLVFAMRAGDVATSPLIIPTELVVRGTTASPCP